MAQRHGPQPTAEIKIKPALVEGQYKAKQTSKNTWAVCEWSLLMGGWVLFVDGLTMEQANTLTSAHNLTLKGTIMEMEKEIDDWKKEVQRQIKLR